MNDEILHGGARRLPARVISGVQSRAQHVSWYEIAPGEECTRHVHQGKSETWLVIAGTGVTHVGESEYDIGPGDMIVTPPGTPHGLRNTGASPLRFVNLVLYEGSGPVTTKEIG